MLKPEEAKTKALLKAEERERKAKEKQKQAEAKVDAERKKNNEIIRKDENHKKFIMGGCVARNLPDPYLYEQHEIEQIVDAAMKSNDCQRVLSRIRREAGADDPSFNNVTNKVDADTNNSDTEDIDEGEDDE